MKLSLNGSRESFIMQVINDRTYKFTRITTINNERFSISSQIRRNHIRADLEA